MMRFLERDGCYMSEKKRQNSKKSTEVKITRRGKIAAKIMAAIISINIIVLAVLGVVVGFFTKTMVGDLSEESAKAQVSSSVNKFDQSFLNVQQLVKAISAEVSVELDLDMALEDPQYLYDYCDELEGRFTKIGEETNITQSIYLYFNNAFFGVAADCWIYADEVGKNYVRQDMFDLEYYDTYNEWYNGPIDEGTARWTDPYVMTGSSKYALITSYVEPLRIDGQIIGLVGMDFDLANLANGLSAEKLYETGYLYLIDSEGNAIVHKNIPWDDTDGDGLGDTIVNINSVGAYQKLIDEMNKNPVGMIELIRADGEMVLAAYDHLSNGWVISSSIPLKEINEINNTLIRIIIIVAALSVVIAVIGAIVLARSISHPIKGVVQAVNKISEGDFTVEVVTKSNDETGILADAVNTMIHNVRELISESKIATEKLLDSSSTLASMSEETTATIEQVGLTIGEVSKATVETAKEAEKGTVVAHVIDDTFNSIIDSSQKMYTKSKDVSEKKSSGFQAINTLMSITETSQKSNKKISEAVVQLDHKTMTITDIIATINSISDQTNLLSLNASIEAARAGEAGRGFAVVAEEIRKLAEDSSSATEEIRTIIQSIQSDSKDTVQIMEEVSRISEEQNVAVENVDEIFKLIFDAINEIIQGIEKISKELEELNEQKNQIVDISSVLSSISEETAASTEEVNASMIDQTQAIEEVAKSAEILNKLATELSEHIRVFKV